MGRVRTRSTGLMTALNMPRTKATTNAVCNESILKPGMYWEMRKMVSAESTQFARMENAFIRMIISL